jgi:lysophospholipase L1-like esterase
VSNLLLAGGTTLLLLLAAEAALRVQIWRREGAGGELGERLERSRRQEYRDLGEVNMSGLVQASPFEDVVYEPKPGIAGLFRGKPFAINDGGFRGRETSREKPPGTFRIAGLGDSVMFGWGVGQEETFLGVLERRLNSLPGSHPRFETLNFAVPGYNTAIEAAVFLRKARDYSPDLVIIQFITNDFGVPLFMQRPRDPLALDRSYLAEWVAGRLSPAGEAEDPELAGNQLRDMRGEERKEVLDRYAHMVGEPGFRRAMKLLADAAAERSIPVVVLTGSASGEKADLVRRVCRKHGFHLVEVKPYVDDYFRRRDLPDSKEDRRKALWVAPGDSHPNAVGHGIYAEALQDRLVSLGLVPAGPLPPSAPPP